MAMFFLVIRIKCLARPDFMDRNKPYVLEEMARKKRYPYLKQDPSIYIYIYIKVARYTGVGTTYMVRRETTRTSSQRRSMRYSIV